MGAFRRQFVLASAAIAAAMILGGAQARAGYVSVADLAGSGGVDAWGQPSASLLAKHETSTSTTGAGDAACPRPYSDDPHAPALPSSPFLKLPLAACNFGNSGAGSSSSSAPSSGPSTPPVGDLPRPQVPPLEPISFLPPQSADIQTFSVASFLFRPPRAA